MSLSKNHIKLIHSLRQKKFRQNKGLFVAEGVKVINELMNSSLEVFQLFITNEFSPDFNTDKIIHISENELKKISTLKSPNKVLGVFKIPDEKDLNQDGLIIALDAVNDPGNLGTIIRLCDWFGVEQLVCSSDTVDCYNQKVIQSTMGSITRVNLKYTDLKEFIKHSRLPVYAADMDGENVYAKQLPSEAILVMGNEANGISSEIEKAITHKLTIPRFGNSQETESLNVATATAILLSEFKRG